MNYCPECGADIRDLFKNPKWQPKYCTHCGKPLGAYLQQPYQPALLNTNAYPAAYQPYLYPRYPLWGWGYPYLLAGFAGHHHDSYGDGGAGYDGSYADYGGFDGFGDFGGDF